jgi:hypothetical protein
VSVNRFKHACELRRKKTVQKEGVVIQRQGFRQQRKYSRLPVAARRHFPRRYPATNKSVPTV